MRVRSHKPAPQSHPALLEWTWPPRQGLCGSGRAALGTERQCKTLGLGWALLLPPLGPSSFSLELVGKRRFLSELRSFLSGCAEGAGGLGESLTEVREQTGAEVPIPMCHQTIVGA